MKPAFHRSGSNPEALRKTFPRNPIKVTPEDLFAESFRAPKPGPNPREALVEVSAAAFAAELEKKQQQQETLKNDLKRRDNLQKEIDNLQTNIKNLAENEKECLRLKELLEIPGCFSMDQRSRSGLGNYKSTGCQHW